MTISRVKFIVYHSSSMNIELNFLHPLGVEGTRVFTKKIIPAIVI